MEVAKIYVSDPAENRRVQFTKEEIEKEMLELKKIFTIVRLVQQNDIYLTNNGKSNGPLCQCFAFWGKEAPCDNCISMNTLKDKKQHTKLEFLGSDVYQVFSRYVEVDGLPYSMECVHKLEDSNLVGDQEREKLIRKLTRYHIALYRDPLTGAYNRRYYVDELQSENIAGGIAMVDIDDFKLINDNFGHDAGDIVLQTFVRTVQRCISEEDLLVRYGGDEFLIIIQNADEKNFTNKLYEILQQIRLAIVPGYSQIHLTASIGGYFSKGFLLEEILHKADKLMYQAKALKNTVITSDLTLQQDVKSDTKILIVDNSAANRLALSDILENDYEIREADTSQECLEILKKNHNQIRLLIINIDMPVMDGHDVLQYMEDRHWIDDIPVIMIANHNTSEKSLKMAYDLGVTDCITLPFNPKIVFRRVFNTIRLYTKQRQLISMISDQIHEKEKNNRIMISILAQIVEFRNGESGKHVVHIKRLCELLLESISLKEGSGYQISSTDKTLIPLAAALHDVGKIGIDEKILNKPGRLTKEEFEIMKTHTIIGANMIDSLDLFKDEPLIQIAHDICRWHHERFDGRGYPDGLVGDAIPLSAQIVSLVDVYDALVSERCYKKAFSHDKAIEMIKNGECGIFNPVLMQCFLEIAPRLQQELQDEKFGLFD